MKQESSMKQAAKREALQQGVTFHFLWYYAENDVIMIQHIASTCYV
jgi:hypothetical protein